MTGAHPRRLGPPRPIYADSPAGIASARAAGLPVLAVDRGLFSAPSLAEATAVVPVVSYAKLESLAA